MEDSKIVRAVIDTNILIKTLISKRQITAPKKIMFALDEKIFISIISNELMTELFIVLKLMVPEEIAENAVFDFESKSEKIKLATDPTKIQYLVKDFSDIKIIHTAIDGNADFLVTNNIKDFSKVFLTASGKTGYTVRPKKFLSILGIKK